MEIQAQDRAQPSGGHVLQERALRELSNAVTAAPARYVPPPSIVEPELSARFPATAHGTIKLLLDSIVTDVVRPALRAGTREEWLEIVRARWHEFFETVHALHVVVARAASEERAALVADELAEEGIGALVASARDVSGVAAADEARFCAETYLRALRVAQRLTTPVPDDMRQRDRELSLAFASAAAMHMFGLLSIHEASKDGGGTTEVGVRGAFDLLRVGALDAYVAVRSAFDLRHREDEEGDDEPLPMDDEDFALATIDDEP